MLVRIKNIFSSQLYFFISYVVFLFFIGMVLVLFDKRESAFWVNQQWTSFSDSFFKYLTYLGDGWFAFAVAILILVFSSKLKYGIYALVSFVLTAGVTQIFKRVFFSDSMRPSHEYFTEFNAGIWHKVEGVELLSANSFPSGHATSAFSIFCLLTLLSKNKFLGLVFLVLAVLTSFSRVYLSQHFLEDIYAGSLIGCVGTVLVVVLLNSMNWSKSFNKPLLNRN